MDASEIRLAALTAFLCCSAAGASEPAAIVHSFGATGDGSRPAAGPLAYGGALYGTTETGGIHGAGIVYRILPDGTETILWSLPPGGAAKSALIVQDGVLYGAQTATAPGASPALGGDIFAVYPGGGGKTLHRFPAGSMEGYAPEGRLLSLNGNFYGTTTSGSGCTPIPSGCGTVFSMSPQGKVTVLYRFKGLPDGAYPHDGLTYWNGALWGATKLGGADCGYSVNGSGCGTIFRLSLDGTENVIYRFQGPEGAFPNGDLLPAKHALLGTALGGNEDNGSAFSVSPAGMETTLHSFSGDADAAAPPAGLVMHGQLGYGTSLMGGTLDGNPGTGLGVIWRIGADGQLAPLYTFANDFFLPVGAQTFLNGSLYGVTEMGGANNAGALYRLQP